MFMILWLNTCFIWHLWSQFSSWVWSVALINQLSPLPLLSCCPILNISLQQLLVSTWADLEPQTIRVNCQDEWGKIIALFCIVGEECNREIYDKKGTDEEWGRYYYPSARWLCTIWKIIYYILYFSIFHWNRSLLLFSIPFLPLAHSRNLPSNSFHTPPNLKLIASVFWLLLWQT